MNQHPTRSASRGPAANDTGSDTARRRPPGRRWWLAALLGACVLGWTLREAVLIVPADWRGAQIGLQVERWSAGELPWDDVQWERTRVQLEALVARTPDSPVLQEHLAQLYTVKGRALWGQGEEDGPGVAAFRQAREIQQRVVALRPLYAHPWANLALMHFAVNSTVDEMFGAWREALRLGPHEPEVRATLKHLVESTWTVAPQDALDWLELNWPGTLERLRREQQAAEQAAAAPAAASGSGEGR